MDYRAVLGVDLGLCSAMKLWALPESLSGIHFLLIFDCSLYGVHIEGLLGLIEGVLTTTHFRVWR